MTRADYQRLLLDVRWLQRRVQILNARGNRCEDCGSPGPQLNVHHGYYRPGRMPWDYPDSALHVLCRSCHEVTHNPEPGAHIVQKLAARFSMDRYKADPDPRAQLWAIAKANESTRVSRDQLMQLLSWLWFKRSVCDLRLMEKVARAAGSALNPYAMLQPGSKAIEAIIGRCGVERAEDEKQEFSAADAAAGLTRRMT